MSHNLNSDERTDCYRITFHRLADIAAEIPPAEVMAREMLLRELPSTGGVAGEDDPAD